MLKSNCEMCRNYEYDEEYDSYMCSVDLDMDEAESFTKCKTILVAMAETGATGKVLMVGDSEYDYAGACEADVDFVGAAYGFGIDAGDTRFPLILTPLQLISLVNIL